MRAKWKRVINTSRIAARSTALQIQGPHRAASTTGKRNPHQSACLNHLNLLVSSNITEMVVVHPVKVAPLVSLVRIEVQRAARNPETGRTSGNVRGRNVPATVSGELNLSRRKASESALSTDS